MRTIVQSKFDCSWDMAGAMPGEDLYLTAYGTVTTRQIPARHCGFYISNTDWFVCHWAELALTHPCYLFRTSA